MSAEAVVWPEGLYVSVSASYGPLEIALRPTIVADATGYVAVNLTLSAEARAQLFAWLGIENEVDS